jgi:hypothetical protein
VSLLNVGAKINVSKSPKNPVIHTNRLNTVITFEIRPLSFVSLASEIFRTALVPNPQLVKLPTRLVVDVNNPDIPIPVGPNSTAMILERIMEIMMLKTCTPPKSEVALKICR